MKIAVEHAEKANARRVTDLHIVIGDLASMVDDSIQFYWDIIAEGTIAQGARLHFQRIPGEMTCGSCGHVFAPGDGTFECPSCGSSFVRITKGDEFRVESIDVKMENE